MEDLNYILIIFGGVVWTALVCWVVWYISNFPEPPKDK